MTDTTPNEDFEAPFVVTLKGGAGYEKPWIVIRGNTAEETVARLGEAQINGLLEKAAEYSAEFQNKTGAAAPAAPATQSGPPSRTNGQAPASQPSGAAAPSNGFDGSQHPEGVVCSAAGCGQPVVGKSIKSKKPPYKTYEMWVCPNQRTRGDGHFSEFVN